MNIENIISGFIGSVIGIVVSGTSGRLTTAIKLNNYRKLILTYSKFILLKNINNYMEDTEKAKSYVTNYVEITYNGKTHDSKYNVMPMLNSEIYKSIPNKFLIKVFSAKPEMYSDLIDIIYSIDFLKANMPSTKIKDFHSWVKNHLNEQKIKNNNAFSHLFSCESLRNYIIHFTGDSDFKIERAKGIGKEIEDISKYLKGSSIFWIGKYFLKQ